MLLRSRAIRLIVALLAILPFTGCGSPTDPEPTVVIYGTVRYADEHTPVPGGAVSEARVYLVHGTGGALARVTTDARGEYRVVHRVSRDDCSDLGMYAAVGDEQQVSPFAGSAELEGACSGLPRRVDLTLLAVGF
jgi:hypothetical protein